MLINGIFVFAGFIFLTGGAFLLPDSLRDLFSVKPWLHRLIILTLCFPAFLLAVYKQKQFPVSKVWVWIFFGFYAVVMSYSSVLRHEAFHSSFDMAIFVQAIWNTLHGDFLYSSIKGGICLLGDHVSPFLALLAIPYALWPDPRLILILQAAAAASCVFPIYRLAEEELKSPALGIVFALAFVLYLPVRNAVRFDFHPEVFAMPLLLWGFYYLQKGRGVLSSLFLLIALSTKENAALVTAFMGGYALFFRRQRTYGSFWILFSIAYFALAVKVIVPHFAKNDYFYLSGNYLAWKSIGLAGFLKHLFSKEAAAYLIKIFAPLGFLSFFHPPTLLLTLPMLLQNLIGRNEMLRSIFFQYTVFLTPFVFISAIYGSRKFLAIRSLGYWVMGWALLMAGVSELYVIENHFKKKANGPTGVLDIPSDRSVRASEFLAPHFAHRKELYIYENKHIHEGGSPAAMNAEFIVLDQSRLGAAATEEYRKLQDAGYAMQDEALGFTILRRKT